MPTNATCDSQPVAVAHHVHTILLRGLHASADGGLSLVQDGLKARAALALDDPDVAELALRVAQCREIVDRIGARLPEVA